MYLGAKRRYINTLPFLFPKGAQPPQFSDHILCGQMAAWIKMPLRMEVGLGPGDIVLDGDPALPPQKERIRRRIRKKKI